MSKTEKYPRRERFGLGFEETRLPDGERKKEQRNWYRGSRGRGSRAHPPQLRTRKGKR